MGLDTRGESTVKLLAEHERARDDSDDCVVQERLGGMSNTRFKVLRSR